MHTVSVPDSGQQVISWTTTPSLSAYVRLEVRHPVSDPAWAFGSMAALTNPIFLG